MRNYLQSAIHGGVNFVDQIFKLCKVVELHWGQWQFSPAEDVMLHVQFLFHKRENIWYRIILSCLQLFLCSASIGMMKSVIVVSSINGGQQQHCWMGRGLAGAAGPSVLPWSSGSLWAQVGGSWRAGRGSSVALPNWQLLVCVMAFLCVHNSENNKAEM